MADKTKIEWADATVNAINGCSLASPGCTNCYAMKQAHRFDARRGLTTKTKGGMVWTGEVRLNEKALLQPLSWSKPRRIFWNAHGDTFHPNVPWEWTAKVMATAFLSPQHIHMILTKRADRMNAWFETLATEGGAEDFSAIIEDLAESAGIECDYPEWVLPLDNVWLGVSVEDQTRADERIPDLLATPAAVHFLSCEPLLGPVDVRKWMPGSYECGLTCGLRLPSYPEIERCTECGWESDDVAAPIFSEGCPACHGELEPVCPDCRHYMVTDHPDTPHIDWVIAGGESGPGARPMHPDWARSLRDQCAAAGVPFHFKQWGEWAPQVGAVDGWTIPDNPEISRYDYRDWEGDHWSAPFSKGWQDEVEDDTVSRIGKKRAGRLLDGVEHNGFPGQVEREHLL